jgi:hypothetical protein
MFLLRHAYITVPFICTLYLIKKLLQYLFEARNLLIVCLNGGKLLQASYYNLLPRHIQKNLESIMNEKMRSMAAPIPLLD